ncbi:MAG: YlxM family DNA-binding protein [Lachnospiraceae bacterium]|nr:YlxM family DNA-binding protein [Lachnospiraceae bacterium]
MEKIVQQGILYDFYGELLTEHQKQVYESVVYENLSLGEIADDLGVSRQAVHDLIKRCDKILEGYEAKLGLIKRFGEVRTRIESMEEILNSPVKEEDRQKLLTLTGEIRELL